MRRKRICGLQIALLCGVAIVGCGQKVEVKNSEPVQQEREETNATTVAYEGEVLETEENYVFDFQGLNATAEVPEWGNNPLNLKSMFPGLVCPGENVTYYVNCGRDNYLYELKDGESRLLLAEVVTSLNIWDGELYFVLHEDGDIRGAGKVCKYDLQTGNLETVLDLDAYYCCVGEAGIYYTETEFVSYEWGYWRIEDLKYYAFEDGGITEYGGERWSQYGDYYALPLMSEDEFVGEGFKNLYTDELLPVSPQKLVMESICNNRYCAISVNGDEFVWIDLQDGSNHKIVLPYSASYSYLYDYMECNGKFYLALGAGIVQEKQMALVDFENDSMKKMTVWTGERKSYTLEEIEQGNYEEIILYSYEQLYTDGENLFVLKHFIDDESESLEDGLLLVQLVEVDGGFEEVELGANANEK